MRDRQRQRGGRLLDREHRPDGRAHRRLGHRRAGDDADRPSSTSSMRDLGIAVLREVGVDTGGCNIQFAVNPADGRLVVIEMNPRVSRSSALASKATGFPIAKIAAKLAIGYTLDEIPNDITLKTPAAFEPTLDYVVVKIPRFAFEKFPGADPELTTTMKSVGEAMSLGRNFTEALGKAMRSMETSGGRASGPSPIRTGPRWTAHWRPVAGTARRPAVHGRAGAAAGRDGGRGERGQRGIDPWFVDQIASLVDLRAEIVRRAGARPARCCGGPSGPACPTGRSPRCARSWPARTGCGSCATGSACVRCTRRSTPARPSSRRSTPYHYSSLRRGDRGRAVGPAEGADPRLRPEPDRAGHRVRLLVRARGDGAARGRLRDRDGQLQPGDRVDRLRHRRPALLRAADLRGRARGRGTPRTRRAARPAARAWSA